MTRRLAAIVAGSVVIILAAIGFGYGTARWWRAEAPVSSQENVARSFNNLGNVQYDLREYAAAKKSDEEALAIYRKALPKDHPDIATSLNNLGNVQDNLREYAAAKKSYEEALAIFRKALPKDHPDTATSLNNLGPVSYTHLRAHET